MCSNPYQNFTVDHDANGVLQIILDVPGRPLNVLDHAVMRELERIVSDLERRSDVRLVVFKSGKESGFLAGADVEAINKIRFSEQAERLLLQGQDLFERIANLPMRTLALLHGPCLGGGLELALACDFRVARDNSSTKIGLPEIKLGLIPGWGGTQRLPKRVGLRHALSMILSGKHLSAREAFEIGLVDRAIDPDRWRDESNRIVERLSKGHSVAPRAWNLGALLRSVEQKLPARWIILSMTRKRLEKKFEHYPAIEAAIHAIADGYRRDTDGFETERREFARLILTPTCRQLLRLFFSRERARQLKTWCPQPAGAVHQDPIRNLGVIGAGAMGAGIAQTAVARGFRVALKEADAESVARGRERIETLINQYAGHKGFAEDRRDALLDQFTIDESISVVSNADCVVEAVVERMDVKRAILAEAESVMSPTAILATNTSALSVSEMAESLVRPDRFAGLHFFNPVHRMELVEVVRGSHTSDDTITQLVSFVRALGKTPIVTADTPGFLVNRILFPYLGEAILMVREGHAVDAIDRDIRRFGMPMGPLELLDRVGLDVALHVSQSLRKILPDANEVAEVLEPLVQRRETGMKAGRGFYDYRGKHRAARETAALVDFPITAPEPVEFRPDGLTAVQRRLIYPMLAEAIRCEEESVVEHSWAIDLGMVLGTGFAPIEVARYA